jgi:hypothetical protein
MTPKPYTKTPFMEELDKKMTENGLTTSSKLTYLRVIEYLSGGKPVEDLSFFLDGDAIEKKLEPLKPNTRRVYYTSIHSALKLTYPMPTEPEGEMIKLYHRKMMRIAHEQQANSNKKSKSQEENWLEWEDVINKWDEMKKDYDHLKSLGDGISHDYQYTFLLHFVVLTLYVKLIPRRNADYLYMVVSQKTPEVLDEETNYLILDENKFIFNKYKTASHYGTAEVSIPDDLIDIFYYYIFAREWNTLPTISNDLKKGKTIPFLRMTNGNAFHEGNSITRHLNKIFKPKKIGCCMLRTIFATEMLLDDQEKSKALATAMGHSVSTQQNTYVKQ